MQGETKPQRRHHEKSKMIEKTHIVLLLHIHLARPPPHIQLLLLGHLAHPPIVLLVPNRRRRRQHKRARHDDGHERQAKGQERVLGHERAVLHADFAGVGRGPKCLVLKRAHDVSLSFGGRNRWIVYGIFVSVVLVLPLNRSCERLFRLDCGGCKSYVALSLVCS